MPPHEGVVRRYAWGLVMETAPSYRRSTDLDTGPVALPGTLVRAPVQAQRTGAAALQQAVALLTGKRVATPSVGTGAAMWRHARRHLAELRVELVWEQEASALLAQCLGAVSAGGLVLLQWQSLPRCKHDALRMPAPPSRWMLVAGVEESWHVQGIHAPTKASALLVVDATVPPVWGCGHNQHLKPGAHPDHAQARRAGLFRPVWTARTLDGGLDCGLVIAAVVLQPPASL
ncbi:hypothetical protein [Acidovorax sp. ACV01]|uniref:hypothetical protein n=1 Tax=Acidovorax sp. ACV01 TaxID=2769311 RepID=UPI00177B177D|nr:hypothetical protein [Acidovorax sp. ACV01]MBD9395286.1 hypothetical protein [Acidovorax sp. ACV01]